MAKQLEMNDANLRSLRAIAYRLAAQSVRAGHDLWSGQTLDEIVETLSRDDSAWDFLDDQEARLDLDVAEARADLTAVFGRNGLIDGWQS